MYISCDVWWKKMKLHENMNIHVKLMQICLIVMIIVLKGNFMYLNEKQKLLTKYIRIKKYNLIINTNITLIFKCKNALIKY